MPTTVEEFVAGAYLLPGDTTDTGICLQRSAIAAMESLLREATTYEDSLSDLAIVHDLMCRRLTHVQRESWLSSPQLADTLHAISAHNPVLRRWHEAVATPSINDVAPPADDDSGFLGSFVLPLVLRDRPQVCGRFALRTDLLGRIAFPDTDWRLQFSERNDGGDKVLSRELILLYLDPLNACFYREDGSKPCLTIPRTCLMRLLANQAIGIAFEAHQPDVVTVKLTRTNRFGQTPIRYDPAYFTSENADVPGMVGGVIERILAAIAEFSPALHSDMCKYLHAIRGYEISADGDRVIGSFSDPTQPGVMNMNITFEGDEPLLSPNCFTWFGHELAHTKNYLIDTVAFQNDMAFVRNRRDMTPKIARYGRGFPIRTLVQIPYVHMYEWDLLMDAYQSGLHGLPWVNTDDPTELVEEIRAEIADGFYFISKHADLTELGSAALTHQEELYRECKRRWSRLRNGRVF